MKVPRNLVRTSRSLSAVIFIRYSLREGFVRSLSTTSPPLHRTFAFYKPDGYLSQFVNNGQIKKRQRMIGELFDRSTPGRNATAHFSGLMTIGRLDEMSEGLLLVTTDGALSHYVNTGGIEKEYYAQLDGLITKDAARELEFGVDISTKSGGGGDPYRTFPCRVVLLKKETTDNLPPRRKKIRDDRHGPTSWISITLREGKNRQVRRMTAAIGFPTLRLIRVRVGCICLFGAGDQDGSRGDIRKIQIIPGEFQELGKDELSALKTSGPF
uniref:Pseudouridine synthase RsuA/RluA-like domain-containing protein n=1 Tax=Corethron hystrix TaxID=216773 RepID=A0A7S1FSW8_9STRA|mmetsp:Transcript_25068/g.57930  ORF Transcript_25068/g.57930 Transcript_25068/m.57930 type:complete len:269 (+) Transcript_25068:103-909(+)